MQALELYGMAYVWYAGNQAIGILRILEIKKNHKIDKSKKDEIKNLKRLSRHCCTYSKLSLL